MENISARPLGARHVRDIQGRLERIQREINYLLADVRRWADEHNMSAATDGRRDYDQPTPDAEHIMGLHGIEHDTSGEIPEHLEERIRGYIVRAITEDEARALTVAEIEAGTRIIDGTLPQ